MKKKNLFILLLTALLCFSFLVSSGWAGSKHSYRRQGIAIGFGTAILGNALFNHYKHSYYSHYRPVLYHNRPVYSYPPHRKHRHRGHWEVRKKWIPSAYKKVWNPGHHNHHGKWVRGHWIIIEARPGHWIKTKVWVSCR